MTRISRSYLTEDDALPDRQDVVQQDKDVVFLLLRLAVHVELPYRVHRKLIPLQLDLVRVWRKVVRVLADVVWERGREQDDLRSSSSRKEAERRSLAEHVDSSDT